MSFPNWRLDAPVIRSGPGILVPVAQSFRCAGAADDVGVGTVRVRARRGAPSAALVAAVAPRPVAPWLTVAAVFLLVAPGLTSAALGHRRDHDIGELDPKLVSALSRTTRVVEVRDQIPCLIVSVPDPRGSEVEEVAVGAVPVLIISLDPGTWIKERTRRGPEVTGLAPGVARGSSKILGDVVLGAWWVTTFRAAVGVAAGVSGVVRRTWSDVYRGIFVSRSPVVR
mmetsp:Transcript_47084/g.152841  ORF Transcript_47084/g.152841 Transcript_47084/m.152841 type:complete len:226 (-) Transcript_47084:542-1219(-)